MAVKYDLVTPDLLREMTDAIVQAAQPLRVILFGSHARGNARADSDVDLLVVEEQPFGPGHNRLARRDASGRHSPVSLCPKIFWCTATTRSVGGQEVETT